MTTTAMSLLWRHVKPDDSHPVDAHYSAQGTWVCYACRERIKEELAEAPPPVVLADDPERPGLHVEGS
jgi:hypothetical protein